MRRIAVVLILTFGFGGLQRSFSQPLPFRVNDTEYFERGGVNVMVFQDIYPEGHQGGISIIQHGIRTASNGDLRLEPTPGQWQPVPRQDRREVNQEGNEITTWLSYPDPAKNRTGFNPILYPDLDFSYQVRVEGAGDAVRVFVDLDKPLPEEWIGHVGFNLELYPTVLFGKSWYLGNQSGIFPRQPNGPVVRDDEGEIQPVPLATGLSLTVASEVEAQRLTIESLSGDLQLYDGRNKHNNGWFVVRSLVPAEATTRAIEWLVCPHAIEGWRYSPVVQVSQVGYHPDQKKVALIELDVRDTDPGIAYLMRIAENGGFEEVRSVEPAEWGTFLRYRYRQFDFSSVTQPGMYMIRYRGVRTEPFQISTDVFKRHVWQPTLEYFLPVQMCHMRVEEQYRVWHGACHLDDARMAPPDSNHFDGYIQGSSTLTDYDAGETVPGLNAGGRHDAGDDDLRIESQADEVWILAATYDLFGIEYDETLVDQAQHLVRIHQPDGRPDLLQQVEHGVLSILGAYKSLGRLYRGIIVPTLSQYVLLGDVTNSTDNLFYDDTLPPTEKSGIHSGKPDDRWVFTEQHAGHEFKGIAALAIAGRVLRSHNPDLALESLTAAETLWKEERASTRSLTDQVKAAVELLLTTQKNEYRQFLLDRREQFVAQISGTGWVLGRAIPQINDPAFEEEIRNAVAGHFAQVQETQRNNPYGVPYRPYIWGAGWGIQEFGVQQYFLHHSFPEIVSPEYLLNALNFVLGKHPGSNTASFASGVGARSITTGYGLNRADWSYIPGGVVSGTALIRPDFPELKNFPYLWQQNEYVMGGGASHFMFLVIAADRVLDPD